MAVNYNDGKWHGWNGGECPVHPESIVETVGKVIKEIDDYQPSQQQYGQAKSVLWNSFEGAFRVIKEHREPRECCVVVNPKGQVMGCNEWHMTSSIAEELGQYALIKVREVLE